MKEPDYSGIITWSIIAVVLGLIIFSIYVSYVNTSQYYQLETPEILEEPEESQTEPEDTSMPYSNEEPENNQPSNKPPEPEPEPPPAEDPPWLTGPSDQDTPWGQGPSD